MSVTKRRFTDEDVAEEHWNGNLGDIVEQIQRKLYEDPAKALDPDH